MSATDSHDPGLCLVLEELNLFETLFVNVSEITVGSCNLIKFE